MSTEWVRPVVKPSNPWPWIVLIVLIAAFVIVGAVAWIDANIPSSVAPSGLPAQSSMPSGPTATTGPLLVILVTSTPTIPPTVTVTNTPPIYCLKGLATNTPCMVRVHQPIPMTSTPIPICSTTVPSGMWCTWKDQP